MPFAIMSLLTVHPGIHTGSFLHSYVGMKLILICLTSFSSLKLRMSSSVKNFDLCYMFSIFIIILLKCYIQQRTKYWKKKKKKRGQREF